MKKFLILAFLSLLLTACGSSSDSTDAAIDEKGFQPFETSEFSIKFPKNWDSLTPKDFVSSVPQGTLAAFRNTIKNDTFVANFSITKVTISDETDSLDYAKGLLQKQSSTLADFEDAGNKEVEVKIKGKIVTTLLTHFLGKKTADSDTVEFLQLAAVNGKEAYIVTAAFREDEESSVKKALETSLQSLVIK